MAQETTQHDTRNLDLNKKLVSSIDNGILILDNQLDIYYFNRWLEIHTGYKEADILGKNIAAIFDSINTKTLKRKINTALRLGTPTFYTASISKYLIPIEIDQIKISSYQYMQQDVSIVALDQEKKLVALIITDQTDITNTNTLLEENILKIQELNSELIKERDTIDKRVLLIKLNLNNQINNVSQAFLNLLGFVQEDILSYDYFEHQKPYISDNLHKQLQLHMNEKKVYEFEYSILTEIGKELVLHVRLVPEYDTYGNHIGFMLFMEDLTDTKKVIAQQEKLLSTSRTSAMGEMISMIAHQWRQPLSVINAIIATVKVKQDLGLLDNKELNGAFNKLEGTVKYLSETIDDFRDYFKPNKIITDIYIYEVMNKSTSFLLEEVKNLGISYTQSIDKKLKIKTHQNELVQCIINILKNSLDAFEDNNIQDQKITLIVQEKSTHISMLFSDNAGGIDKKIIKKIFEPYFSTKAKNGTGLGLYMSKTIIEEHLNGKITIISKDGMTETLIELPKSLEQTEEST